MRWCKIYLEIFLSFNKWKEVVSSINQQQIKKIP